MRKIMLIGFIGVVSLLVAGCFGAILLTETAQFVIESTAYGHDATIDFGVVDPGGSAVVLSGTLTNIATQDIVVESVTIEGSGYSASLPETPFTIATGAEVAASLTFDPDDSGSYVGTVTLGVENAEAAFVVNLTGEGNYAPVAYPAVTVTGAGDLADTEPPNGTYIRAGTQTDFVVSEYSEENVDYPTPSYELPGTPYTIWAAVVDDGGRGWVIDRLRI